MRVRLARLLAVAVVVSGCTGGGDSDGTGSTTTEQLPLTNPSETLAAASTDVAPTVTTEPAPSPEYCALAEEAVEGNFDFTDPEEVKRLTQRPELTTRQRALIAVGAADAVREVSLGSGWSNDELVNAVNEVCGLDLAPLTLTP
jgi:hypothetical protein